MTDESYCDDAERVLHAILSAEWDRDRVSPQALADRKNASLGRLAIYTQSHLFAIFHRDLDARGKSPVVAALEWQVKQITDLSGPFFLKNKQKNVPVKPALRVRIDRLPDNEAHAEVDGKITAGLSPILVKAGSLRREGWPSRKLHALCHRKGMGQLAGTIAVAVNRGIACLRVKRAT